MSRADIDALLKFGPKPTIDDADEISRIVDKLKIENETDLEKVKKAFTLAQFALGAQADQFDDVEKNLVEEIQGLRKQLKSSQADISKPSRDVRELESENARLETKIDSLRTEIQELESKLYNEQTEKDKISSKLEDAERQLTKVKKDNARLEDDVKEYTKQNQSLLDKKYAKSGDEIDVMRDKIKQKNKRIEELEDEALKYIEENNKLDNLLQQNKTELEDAIFQMNKTTEEIKKLRLVQEQSDLQIDQHRKECEILKSQIANLNQQLISSHGQDSVILNTVEARIKEYNQALQIKDEEIKNLQELVINLRDNLNRIRMDSDKASVASLSKALQDKDKQIEILKNQIEEYTKEMDKSSAIINNLNKNVMQASKAFSYTGQGFVSKEADQKIKFLENLLKESEARIRDAEQHASDKEKALTEALNRLDDYESGDYQLQQAVGEIKNYKNQIKIRDRDIETLTKHINKIDYVLNEALEENDALRAKLGMEPKEKINLDELKDLKAVRAQETRAINHVLQKEIESLEEERLRLKEKVRKLAKLASTKGNIASIIGDDFDLNLEQSKDLINSKLKDLDSKYQLTNQASKQLNFEVEDLRRKNEQLLQLQRDYQNENQQLEQGLKEIHNNLQNLKPNAKGDVIIKCPTLEKLLEHMESNKVSRTTLRNLALYNFSDAGGEGNLNHLVLKSEIDYLQGRNEELRIQLTETKNEAAKQQIGLNKAQDEINKLNEKVKLLNKSSINADTFQILKLPAGMSPSSNDVISALNEYLVDTLQELEEYKRISTTAEKDLEKLKRKYAVQRHQLALLYKDYMEENNLWKTEKANLMNEIKKFNGLIQDDSIKLQEYNRLLNTLEKDESEIRRRLAENSRQMFVLRTTEKQLARKCDALQDMEVKMTKENKKLRTDIIQMEVAVQQRIGYLERFKEMSNFKILSFQKQLEECVPISKLEAVNKEYDEVVQNYRQLLEKQDVFETKNEMLLSFEEQNKKYASEIEFLKRELENEKEKVHILEESMEKMKSYSAYSSPSGKVKDISDASGISLAKRLAAIEMKEINERQRADYAQRMYDEQRNLLRSVENRNLELENNYAKLSKMYLTLQKTEQGLREELSNCIPKAVNNADKKRIAEFEKSESMLRIEVARLKEVAEITLYQTEAIEFIHNLNKKELDCLGSIEVLSYDDDKTEMGKLHRQIISLQISEATAIRKLQNAIQLNKKLETQLIRAEQKLDQERQDSFYMKKEYTSKISYLRSTIQDLRHKYAGSIPLKQQEKFNASKQALLDSKKELMSKLRQVDDEKHELEDKIAEYQSRMEGLDILKNLTSTDAYRTNEKLLEWHKKLENLRISNLKLERANKRYKDEKKFLEEVNRKYEITIVQLEEDIVRTEKEFDQKVLIWEHREADLERTIEHLKQQHQYIENLALNFEEISGKMPDPSLPVPNQLEQAMDIIRQHIKVLAESKVQADIAKKRVTDLEEKLRKVEQDVTLRDKAIAELRLRLPASADRDLIVESSLSGNRSESVAPVRAAQSTIEGFQHRLNQKEQTIIKYQELLQLARDEISKLNKQHEIEINNLMDKLNTTRDSNLQKLKENLKFTPRSDRIATKSELARLQELEEVTVEQDNTISALNDKIRKLNSDIDSWKFRYEALIEKFNRDKAMIEKEQENAMQRLNQQIEEHREKIRDQEAEMGLIIAELENQKQINSKSPSNTMKALVEKLKHQLAEKEEQHQRLTKALVDLRSDITNIAKTNLLSAADEQKQVQQIMDKTREGLDDKIVTLEEENSKLRRELKLKIKINDDLALENEHLNGQLKTKDQKIKKLFDDNQRLADDTKRVYTDKSSQHLYADNKTNDVEYLRRQIRGLEEKLRRQRPAEKPYETTTNNALTQKLRDRIKELEGEVTTLSDELKNAKRLVTVDASKSGKNESQQVLFKPDQQLHQKYHYILNENTILKREKHDLEVEILALKRDNEMKTNQLANENQLLKNELDKLKQMKSQNFTISKLSSNENLLSKISKLNEENFELKRQLENVKDDSPKNKRKIEEMTKYIELLKSEIEQLKNDNPDSVSSNSSLKRIGESGKSTKELEKTIAMMKKIIVKLQQENEALKSNSIN